MLLILTNILLILALLINE